MKACEEDFQEWGYDSRAGIGGWVEASPGNNTSLLERRVVVGRHRGPLPTMEYGIMARTSAHPRWCCDLGKGCVYDEVNSTVLVYGGLGLGSEVLGVLQVCL